MKKSVIILVAIAFCVSLSLAAQDESLQAKPKPCQYTGSLKDKMENPDRIFVEIQGKIKEIYFIPEDKKECTLWQDLTVGDNVRIICKEKKDRIEAICVQKILPGTTLQGVTIQGGATIK